MQGIAARIASLAAASEILVSRTVKDLVAGSGLRFNDRGRHLLKGAAGRDGTLRSLKLKLGTRLGLASADCGVLLLALNCRAAFAIVCPELSE